MPVDAAQLELHRTALTGHCYRMLGSPFDAEDAVQETMVRAWRSLDRFDGRASLRTWLYRIATNVCLDAFQDRSRRARVIDDGPVGTVDDELQTRERTHWLEPIADARAMPADADPFERAWLRQSTRLAFVAALQHLPPRQRAALLLTEVLGWSAAETAQCLEMSVAAVNSALQRARATLAARNVNMGAGSAGRSEDPDSRPSTAAAALTNPDDLSAEDATLLDRYVDAFERYDVEALVSLMREDATLSMPPYTLWLQGHAAIARWLSGRGAGCGGSRLARVEASGTTALAQWRPAPDIGGYRAWAIIALEMADGRISSMTSFLDTTHLFPLFGLPLEITST